MIFQYKTRLQKLSSLIIILLLITVCLLVYQQFILSFLFLTSFIIMSITWYRELAEELIIYDLKMASGQQQYNYFIDKFSKKSERALSRLSKKGIIEIKKSVVILIDMSRPCSFDNKKT